MKKVSCHSFWLLTMVVVISLIFLTGSVSPLQAESSSPPAHRVVHVHDDHATCWDFRTGWYGDSVDQDVVDRMTDRGLVPQEGWKGSRDIFSRMMKSLRDGPWSELTPKEAVTKFLGTYLVSTDLESAPGTLDRSPDGAGEGQGIDVDDDTIMIDGVKLTIRR